MTEINIIKNGFNSWVLDNINLGKLLISSSTKVFSADL